MKKNILFLGTILFGFLTFLSSGLTSVNAGGLPYDIALTNITFCYNGCGVKDVLGCDVCNVRTRYRIANIGPQNYTYKDGDVIEFGLGSAPGPNILNVFSKKLPASLAKGKYFDGYDTRTLSVCPNNSYSRVGNQWGQPFDLNSSNDLKIFTTPVKKCL